MRVAAVQFRAVREDLDASLRALCGLAQRAASVPDMELVVLPEMAVTGYVFPDPDAVAEVAEPPRGPTFTALSPIAKSKGTWLVCGFPERAADRLFNSAMVIDPAGQLVSVYRKTLLFEADLPWATPGDSGYQAFDTAGGRFGVGICMDLNDDAFVAWALSSELDAIAFPTNWVHSDDDPIDPWSYWSWRLGPSGAALVAANTWGRDGSVQFTGASAVLQRRTIRAHLPVTGDGVCGCVID